MTYIMLLAGFLLLIKGADFFVDGSSSIAKLLRIPSVIIGLTIVAFGTSAPEAAVSITAAISGNNDIAIGNVIGSNIFNLLMVLGVCGVISPLTIDKEILHGDYIYSLIISLVLMLMIMIDHKVGRIDGVILLLLFVFFLVKTVRSALKKRTSDEDIKKLSPFLSLVFIFGGIVAVVIGGDMVVNSASAIAASFGLSQTLIGLTIVALGTSLPELVTSIVAARKGETGLAMGNVVGSNIFNILMVLAASAAIHPVSVTILSVYDMACLIIFTVITFFLAKSHYEVRRREGIIMVAMYAAYVVYIIIR